MVSMKMENTLTPWAPLDPLFARAAEDSATVASPEKPGIMSRIRVFWV